MTLVTAKSWKYLCLLYEHLTWWWPEGFWLTHLHLQHDQYNNKNSHVSDTQFLDISYKTTGWLSQKLLRPMQLVHNFIRQRGILKIFNGTQYNFIRILLLLYSINILCNGCNCWTHNGSLLNWDETWNDPCIHNLPSFTFPFFCINNVTIFKMS
jgi:hypothetical protein